MSSEKLDKWQRLLLAFSAFGLMPVALLYGFMPEKTVTPLFGLAMDSVNARHIMRAIMGLYFGQLVFWSLGAFYRHLRLPALYMLTTFMLSLFFVRLVSVFADGMPHWFLLVSLALEGVVGALGMVLLCKAKSQTQGVN